MDSIWKFIIWFTGSLVGGVILNDFLWNPFLTSFIYAVLIGALAIKDG